MVPNRHAARCVDRADQHKIALVQNACVSIADIDHLEWWSVVLRDAGEGVYVVIDEARQGEATTEQVENRAAAREPRAGQIAVGPLPSVALDIRTRSFRRAYRLVRQREPGVGVG